MNPTLQELAALAASLPTGTPPERAQAALELWHACARALQPPAAPDSFNDKKPLDKLLAQALPTRDAADRVKLWRDFLSVWEERLARENQNRIEAQAAARGMIVNMGETAPGEYARRAEETITLHREHGVRHATEIQLAFVSWVEESKARNYSERGKKGHAAKKALEVETTPKKRTSKPLTPPKRAAEPPKRATTPRKRK